MALINEDSVNTQFLKCHHVILAALVIQLVDLQLKALAGFLHLLDGEVLRLLRLGLVDAHQDLIHLLFQNGPLTLGAHWDFLKLAVTDDDRVILARGDASAELLAVLGFKVLSGSNKDIGGRVQL